MKKLSHLLLTSVMAFNAMFAVPLLVPSGVAHADNKDQVCKGISAIGGGNACNGSDAGNQLSTFIRRIINILIFLVGAISVLMIVIGGLRYVLSGGDSAQTKGAKDTILYAVIGVVVAVLAFAIVNFVIDNL